MRILGIDPSFKRTGWCVVETQFDGRFIVLKAGSIPLSYYKSTKILPELTEGLGMATIADEIRSIVAVSYLDVVAIEKAPFMVHAGAGLLQQVLGSIKATVCSYVGVYKELYPVTVKKLVSGSGKAEKKQLAAAVENRLAELWEFDNYDESDACAIAMAYWLQVTNDNNGHTRSN